MVNADHGGNTDNGKSTGGYLVKLGTGAISWSSKTDQINIMLQHIMREKGRVILMGSILLYIIRKIPTTT